jgi:hypothetical protein
MLLAPRSRHRGRKLPRPDGRTVLARRYRELQRQFADELGPLTPIDQVLLDSCPPLPAAATTNPARNAGMKRVLRAAGCMREVS